MQFVIQEQQRSGKAPARAESPQHHFAPVSIAIIYEDFTAGIAAREFSDKLESELGPEFGVRRDVWSFDILHEPESRLRAAADAAAAEIVIIAARRTESRLPRHIRDWIASWSPLKQGTSSALIGLVETDCEEDGKAANLQWHLSAVAEDANMDFFCQTWKCPSWSNWPSLEEEEEQAEDTAEPQAVGMGN
jgi:hypothetical protein